MAQHPADNFDGVLKDLTHTMMSVARESVNLIKRSDQQHAMKLQRRQEWDIYLEFLRMLFNLVDRLSAFHIPIQAQRDFMNSLEDSVAHELNTVLAPSLSASELDDMAVTLSVGQTVAESREIYEKFKFVVTDQTKERDEYFQFFAERVSSKAGAAGKKEIVSAAFLCGTAVIPAFNTLFQDAFKPKQDPLPMPTPEASESSPASESTDQTDTASAPEGTTGSNFIKLISVVSKAQGEEVETWWGLHPQFRRDLPQNEAKELSKHMNRVTRIVGERFSVVVSLAQAETNPPESNQPVGNA